MLPAAWPRTKACNLVQAFTRRGRAFMDHPKNAHRTPSNDAHMHLQHVSVHAFLCERTCTQVTSVTTSPRAQMSAYTRAHTHTCMHTHTGTRAHGHTGTHAHVQRQSLLRQGRPANTTSQFVPAEHGVSTFAGPPPRFSLDPSMAKISAAWDHARWPQWSSP